jgi:hypothetical protein
VGPGVGSTSKPQENSTAHNNFANASDLHLDYGFQNYERTLLLFFFVHDEEFRWFKMHPEVVACDTTFGVEKNEERTLHNYRCGRQQFSLQLREGLHSKRRSLGVLRFVLPCPACRLGQCTLPPCEKNLNRLVCAAVHNFGTNLWKWNGLPKCRGGRHSERRTTRGIGRSLTVSTWSCATGRTTLRRRPNIGIHDFSFLPG